MGYYQPVSIPSDRQTRRSRARLRHLLYFLGVPVLFVFWRLLASRWIAPGVRRLDSWFLCLSILGMLLFLALLIELCMRQKRDMQDILGLGPMRKDEQEAVYPTQQAELHFLKGLQWNMLYYSLAGFGAIYALTFAVKLTPAVGLCLYSVAVGLKVYSVYVIVQVQFNMRDARLQIARTRYFRRRYRTAADAQAQLKDERRIWRDARFFIPILISVSFGFAVVTLRLWESAWKAFLCVVGMVFA